MQVFEGLKTFFERNQTAPVSINENKLNIMAIILTKKLGKQVPVGAHLAVCYGIVHIGTQPSDMYGEKDTLLVLFETPHERIEVDGREKPMSIVKRYGLGSSGGMDPKSTLRQHLAAWRGRDFTAEEMKHFELVKILGKGCQIQVTHSEEGRHKIVAVMGVPKGMDVPPPQNPLVEYSIKDGRDEVYNKLPDWIKKACEQCAEWNAGAAEPESHEEPAAEDDSVPF